MVSHGSSEPPPPTWEGLQAAAEGPASPAVEKRAEPMTSLPRAGCVASVVPAAHCAASAPAVTTLAFIHYLLI